MQSLRGWIERFGVIRCSIVRVRFPGGWQGCIPAGLSFPSMDT